MSPANSAAARVAAAAPIFAALGDPTRLRLVVKLCGSGPLSIGELSKGSRVTRQAVTKHLRLLAHAGLARDRRVGRTRIWTLDVDRLERARACLDHISAQWDVALASLKAFVESA